MSEEFPPESEGTAAEQDAMAAEWEAALAQQLADRLCSDSTRGLRTALGFELAH